MIGSKVFRFIFFSFCIFILSCRKDKEESVCEKLFEQRNAYTYLLPTDSMGVIEGFAYTKRGKNIAKAEVKKADEFAYIKKGGMWFTGKVGNTDIKGMIRQGRYKDEERTRVESVAETHNNHASDLTYKILNAFNYCTCYTQIDDLGYYYYQPTDKDKHNVMILRTVKK